MWNRLARGVRLLAAAAVVVVPIAAVLTIGVVGGAAPASAASEGPLVASHSALCAGIPNESLSVGTAATQNACDGGDDQIFELRDAGGGQVEMVVKHSDLCLAVQAASTTAGALVIQTDCNGASESRWTATTVTGGLRLEAAHSGLCLDVYGGGTDPGVALIQWSCHGGANQVFDWQSVEVGDGNCVDGLSAEAEHGVLSGDMGVVSDASASGGAYVEVPDGTGNYWSLGSPSTAAFCFDVAEAGTYRIETQAWGQVGSNSLFVTVDGAPAGGYVWDVHRVGGFTADNVSDRFGDDPVEMELSAGEHTIVFHHRKDGTRLDSVTLVRTGTGGGGGGGGGECVAGLSAEAEDGALAGDMGVVSDASASGGAYVEVPDGTGNYWSLGSPSTAAFCFDVAEAGTYRIETRAWAQSGSNSFFVTVDDAPVDGFVWDLRKDDTFVTDNVSDRFGDDPVEVELDVGEHSVVIHHRKDGTKLDSLTLVRTGGGGGGGGGGVNTTGAWDPVVDVGLVPVAMANIGSGEVLLWSAYGRFTFGGENGYTETAIYNPSTGAIRAQRVSNTQHDMFCPGIANLPDGRVLVSGGSGNAETSIYDPASDSWEDAADMNIGRGYQGNVTLGDGSVLTVGGSWSGGVGDKASEIYRNGSWTTLPGIEGGGTLETADSRGQYRADNHMWLFAWTGNRVFHAGPSRTMHWLDVSGQGSVASAGVRGNDGDAMNGNAVMYDAGKILVTGGAPDYDTSVGTANAHVIDLNGGVSVRQVADLETPRTLHNSVVLPSGEVVATGGQRVSRLFTDDQAILVAELFDPATETWSSLAPMSVPRTYHSAALLLLDGRVMVGGGGLCGNCSTNHPDTQILTPPYLLDADGNPKARPTITSAPGSASHGATIAVDVDGGAAEFALVRMANSTHSVNNAQRRVPLAFTSSGGGSYQVTIPADPGVAPPGAYMLFALDANGTPSVADVVNVG